MTSPIRLILSDVDGVMTDGRIVIDAEGNETKRFHVRDGLGIRLWQRAGGAFGIITARQSAAVAHRAAELDIGIVQQNSKDKLAAANQIASQRNMTLAEIAYIGDDLPDLALIQAAGLGIAVADAALPVRQAANLVLETSGGHGAVREMVEIILQQQGKLEALVADFH